MTHPLADSRWQAFARWWNRNHHQRRAHDWLCAHSRRTAYAYYFPPEAFDEVMFITKRYYSSEYRRLHQVSAWSLWRLIHPLHNKRISAIERAADKFESQRTQLKRLKSSLDGKPTIPDKNGLVIERKRRRVFNRPTAT